MPGLLEVGRELVSRKAVISNDVPATMFVPVKPLATVHRIKPKTAALLSTGCNKSAADNAAATPLVNIAPFSTFSAAQFEPRLTPRGQESPDGWQDCNCFSKTYCDRRNLIVALFMSPDASLWISPLPSPCDEPAACKYSCEQRQCGR